MNIEDLSVVHRYTFENIEPCCKFISFNELRLQKTIKSYKLYSMTKYVFWSEKPVISHGRFEVTCSYHK